VLKNWRDVNNTNNLVCFSIFRRLSVYKFLNLPTDLRVTYTIVKSLLQEHITVHICSIFACTHKEQQTKGIDFVHLLQYLY